MQELEVKVAFLEHQLLELDGVVRELYARVEGLEKLVREAQAGRESADSVEARDVLFEKPPHY